MNPYDLPFIPGTVTSTSLPLGRFLPPIPDGILPQWLSEHAPRKSTAIRTWLLDPFGAHPGIAVEAARQGYCVLVAANNPISRFLIEASAQRVSESDLRSALADLAAVPVANERLEPHIRSLYLTECAACGAEISAQAFIWEREEHRISARIYTCPLCNDAGERPATEKDQVRAQRYTQGGLHRARALERVAPRDDPDRASVEAALEAYLPRAIYALFTLINRYETFPEPRQRILTHLLLAALDLGNNLWPYPNPRARPRQLTTPTRFRENNLWFALEEALNAAASAAAHTAAIPLTIWPEQPPPSGGICLFEGRLKDLANQKRALAADAGIEIAAVISALPRPNQAFWTLSALWAGWLWGRAAAEPFKIVLRRKRYDWTWHASALSAAFSNLPALLKPGTLVFALLSELEPGFLSAALLAPSQLGFMIQGVALRAESGLAQITWTSGEAPASHEARSEGSTEQAERAWVKQLSASAAQAGRDCIALRAEPVSFLQLQGQALAAALPPFQPPPAAELSPAELTSLAQNAYPQIFSFRNGFLRFGGTEHSLESGAWWAEPKSGTDEALTPLSDRLEIALVNLLQSQGQVQLEALEHALCRQFPGALTPEPEYIRSCLDSYAAESAPASGLWQLRPSDTSEQRNLDIKTIGQLLAQLGSRLGLQVQQEQGARTGRRPAIVWIGRDGRARMVFHLIASAVIGPVLQNREFPAAQSIIVLPGSRAGLLTYKLRRDGRLSQIVGTGWRFIKFRHVHQLASNSLLTLENLDAYLEQDPLTRSDAQMSLL